MDLGSRKFVFYIVSLLVLSGVGVLAYDLLGVSKFHMKKVKIFCDESVENVGVKNARSFELLKSYAHDRENFEKLDPYKAENFFKDSIHVANCTEAKLFSKRFNGARSVKVLINGEEVSVTVLTENLTFLDEEQSY